MKKKMILVTFIIVFITIITVSTILILSKNKPKNTPDGVWNDFVSLINAANFTLIYYF